MSGPVKEAKEMYHYMQLDPYLIRHHNEEMRNEVSKLRLQKRLQGDKGRTSQLYAFSVRLWSALHPLRRTGLAGH